MPATQRRIAICIDDVGQHDAINAGARELLARGRVSALSAMVHGPCWDEGRVLLRDARRTADVGLHLDLSEPWGDRRFVRPWRRLVAESLLGRLDTAALRIEIEAQLDAFEHGLGHSPDFIDGHRHVHQLPGVRDLLVQALVRRYPTRPPWLRRTVPRATFAVKPWAVAALGAAGLDRLLQRHAIAHNRRLVGVYGFSDDERCYLHRLTRWLAIMQDGDLLMCHPAWQVARPDDPIARARAVEHRVLCGSAFGRALEDAGIRVARMSELMAATAAA
jgi:chitin disaccharide deacetylase